MYINSLNIEKYQVLEYINIDFQIPKDDENIVNVIAGVNGCGKTTLLEWIRSRLTSDNLNGKIIRDDNINLSNNTWVDNIHTFNKKLAKENKYINGIHSSPRIIYLPSKMTFQYNAVNNLNTSYRFLNIIESNNLIGNAELFIKNYIIDKERTSIKSNPKERTKDAINSFNNIFKNSDFITKLIDLDKFNNNKPIFETINKDRITIDKLSSGEQQLYARVVSLMILNPHNSVILIDEPEIALHPKWQTDIMKIYASIGKNNQFIVTTHSPFIISQTSYKNLIFLVKENEKISVIQPTQPPRDGDINTIIDKFMGANYMPKKLKVLHESYQKLFDENKEDTEEAKEIEKEIKEFESTNSSFWQGINFDKALR
jgi:predicted ATP-binding protein involved in virulence